jgi:plastocyanin
MEAEMIRVRYAALILSTAAVLVLAGSALAASAGVNITESAGRYSFGPAKVFINVGNKVTWTNRSDAPHTVTSNSGAELKSPTLSAGATFNHAFSTIGTFAYHCTIHTYMKGIVVVLAAGATLPATDAVGSATTPAQQQPLAVGLIGLLTVAVGFLGASFYLRRRHM